MNELSLNVEFGAHAFEEFGYLAGSDQDRAADVMTMFTDPSISAIIANRGGWGCNRMIDLVSFSTPLTSCSSLDPFSFLLFHLSSFLCPVSSLLKSSETLFHSSSSSSFLPSSSILSSQLNYTTIAANPKVIMGYSDLTGLLNAITTQTGMVTFHGAMGIDDWTGLNGTTYTYWNQVIAAPSPSLLYSNPPTYSNATWTITSGKTQGRLVGGNLSVFTAMIGSIYFPSNFKGTILFLEDVGEPPYHIDRMLTTLHLAGVLSQISGFVFGICTDCEAPPPTNQSLSLTQVLM
jgi:muramoyltetrapeptide carboxypeptidase LdcA involved in peptidoglycan recycling